MRTFSLLLAVSFFLLPITVFSQFQFSLELQEDSITYLVKLKPERTYKSPMNITNSAQCSFVVPTGGFRVGNLKNIKGTWVNENDVIAPKNKPENDYLIFNLSGNISNLEYIEGEEVILFSFQNVGKRTGILDFVSKEDIRFFKSKKLNIGNHLSVLGAGHINAFTGTYPSKGTKPSLPIAEAAVLTKANEGELEKSDIVLGQFNSNIFELNTSVKNQAIQLEWIVGMTDKTKGFVIEKSMDGIHFEAIKEITGNADYHLEETDDSPDYGMNYYRIRQEYASGSYRYSSIKKEAYYLDESSITMYPNPVKEHLSIKVGHFTKLNGQVHIFNMAGVEMTNKELDTNNKQLQFNTSTFPGGLYFLVIRANNTKIIERQFVVENGK